MDNDQTQILSEGTEDYPLDPNVAEDAEKCPYCGTMIHAGEQFCAKCGYQRGTWESSTADTESAPSGTEAPYKLVSPEGEEHPLLAGETVIGRGEVGLQIDDGYISRQHARLEIGEDTITLSDLGSANGTFVDGVQLDPDTPLEIAAGQSVKFGRQEFVLEINETVDSESVGKLEELDEEAETVLQDEPVTEVAPAVEETGQGAPAEEPVTEQSPWSIYRGDELFAALAIGETTLGRKAGKCQLLISGDGYISGLHAKAIATEEACEIVDLGSTNGTFLNGERLEPEAVAQIQPGDTLKLGQTELTIVFSDQDAADEDQPEPVDAEEPPVEDEAGEQQAPEE